MEDTRELLKNKSISTGTVLVRGNEIVGAQREKTPVYGDEYL